MITASNLHRSYSIGKKSIEILHGVDLHIAAGEKVFLCGPSGAGKTTLMYTLAGLETPQEGKVTIDGTDIYALSATPGRVPEPEHGVYFPELSADAGIDSAGKRLSGFLHWQEAARGICEGTDGARGSVPPPEPPAQRAERRGTAARGNRPCPGERRPHYFADEPTGNLDRKNGAEVLDLLFGLADESRKTLVIVTHDEHLARRGDRIITIMDGQAV